MHKSTIIRITVCGDSTRSSISGMETVGYNTFYMLDEARKQAAQTHLEVREAMLRLQKHRDISALHISHGTLLQLRGCTIRLDTKPNYDRNAIHLTVDDKRLLGRTPDGFQIHHWSKDIDAIDLDELIVGVSPLQAVCQLAKYTDLQGMVILMDWLTCNNSEMRVCTHQKLVEYIHSLGSFAGARLCRSAVSRSMEGTDSPQETILRLKASDYGFQGAVPNYEIIDPAAGKTMRVDIAYPKDHIVIEYDGRYHYTMNRWEYDLDKRNRIRAAGYQPFVATHADMATEESLNRFLAMISRAMLRYRSTGSFE